MLVNAAGKAEGRGAREKRLCVCDRMSFVSEGVFAKRAEESERA